MDLEDLKRKIEILLFASSEPLSIRSIKHALLVENDNIINNALNELSKEYNSSKGLFIEKVQGGYQIFTKPEYDYLMKRLQEEEKGYIISGAALEVLAIVSVFQPITKPEIESIRGVSSEGVIKHLVDIGFLKIAGRLHSPGRPLLYTITPEFLRYFHIAENEDLRELYEKFSKEFEIKERATNS